MYDLVSRKKEREVGAIQKGLWRTRNRSQDTPGKEDPRHARFGKTRVDNRLKEDKNYKHVGAWGLGDVKGEEAKLRHPPSKEEAGAVKQLM